MSRVNVNMNFNTEIAREIGINAAIILCNIEFWVLRNSKNQHNYHDGKYWTYNSLEAWTELFNWLTIDQVRTAIKKLVKAGYIIEGEYNSDKRDRTKWYTSQVKNCKLYNEDLHLGKIPASLGKNPSSYKEQILNTDIKQYIHSPSKIESVDSLDQVPDSPSKFFETKSPVMYADAIMKASKPKRKVMDQILAHFDSVVLKEAIPYEPKRLYGRLLGVINNWKVDEDPSKVNLSTGRKLMQ